jgi:hypothetical protein
MMPGLLISLVERVVERILLPLAFVMRDLGALLRAPPRPSDAPLISGIAPAEVGNARTLSDAQLEQLHTWLRLHQAGWRRHASPPYVPSYDARVEHSDGTKTDMLFFTHIRPEVRFFQQLKTGQRDGGWLSVPLAEVERLISLLREKA